MLEPTMVLLEEEIEIRIQSLKDNLENLYQEFENEQTSVQTEFQQSQELKGGIAPFNSVILNDKFKTIFLFVFFIFMFRTRMKECFVFRKLFKTLQSIVYL